MAKSYGEFSMPTTPATESSTRPFTRSRNQGSTSSPQKFDSPGPMKKKKMPSTEQLIEEPDEFASAEIRRFPLIIQWILFLSKMYLDFDPIIKAGFYLGLSIICSSITTMAEPFREYSMFQKESFFNQWFVKLSWGWTFWLLVAFFGLCGYLEGGGQIRKIARNITRLLVGTAMWYSVTAVFIGGIEKTTGKCSREDFLSRKECVNSGATWQQFDISGHAFLLVYCSLLILEEARGFFNWETEEQLGHHHDEVTSSEFENVIKPRIDIVVRVIAVALAILAVIWDFQLIITLVYYHSFIQRFLGVALGVAAWYFTYRVWYPRFWPGPPGDMEEE